MYGSKFKLESFVLLTLEIFPSPINSIVFILYYIKICSCRQRIQIKISSMKNITHLTYLWAWMIVPWLSHWKIFKTGSYTRRNILKMTSVGKYIRKWTSTMFLGCFLEQSQGAMKSTWRKNSMRNSRDINSGPLFKLIRFLAIKSKNKAE